MPHTPYPGLLWYRLLAVGSGTQLHASPDLGAIIAAQAAWQVLGVTSYVVPEWVVVVV